MSVSSIIRRIALGAAVAGGLAVGLSGAALAEDAVTTAEVNMRSGPGTNFPVIMGLPEGAGVDYVGRGCAGSWCNIRYDGVRGWVNANYLEETDGDRRPPIVVRPAPPVYMPPPVYIPPPVYDPPPVYGRPWRPRPDYDRPRPRPPGGDWDRPRPPGGGWGDRPRPPIGGPGPGPRPPIAQPQPAPPAIGGTMVPLQPRGTGPIIGPPGGIPRGGTGPCANVPVGVVCQ